MEVTPLGIATAVNAQHPENKPEGIAVRAAGRAAVFRLLQPLKAAAPMLVTLAGMVTAVNLLQREKASAPMLVSELVADNVTLVKEL
jgi:hypothetical protein